MSGHSHWSGIKHKKELTDTKRGKMFTKATRLITVSARQGGTDPDTNPSLRLAIEKAKEVNMPKTNIERAIQKGSGKDSSANNMEEVSYEAFGPGGVAMIIKGITDNKNRAVGDIRRTLAKHGGRIAENGSVAWMFDLKSRIEVTDRNNLRLSDDDLELAIIESGADDIRKEDGKILIYAESNLTQKVQSSLEKNGIKTSLPEIELIPKQTVAISEKDQEKLDKTLEELDDCDDVTEVFTNFKF